RGGRLFTGTAGRPIGPRSKGPSALEGGTGVSDIECGMTSVGSQALPSPPQLERFEVLDVHQCLEFLHSGDLGRVAFETDGDIDIFPVNYACTGEIVVFRTASMTRLQRSPRVRVTFEVDSWNPLTGVGWSVMLKGSAHEVTNGWDPFSKSLRQGPVVPLAPGKREHWIAIHPSQITGRRFRVAPEGSSPTTSSV
ncbi:MAG: pyridoxamine 5'-phosphate oxidase family protein, partial [Candidatus Dormibacteraeota bacterium]|nr:pyridoxamine 5'-phosphate oxidase family protein [Candidatus Dormibacteraeota bacterium]